MYTNIFFFYIINIPYKLSKYNNTPCLIKIIHIYNLLEFTFANFIAFAVLMGDFYMIYLYNMDSIGFYFSSLLFCYYARLYLACNN